MTTRPDRRVRRTREAIHRAFVELMLEKGYDAVTVADLIDRADIGRSTFYTHFTDKQNVLYGILDELVDTMRVEREARSSELFGFSRAMFEHVHEQRDLLRAFLGRRSATVVRNRVQDALAELVREDLEAVATRPGVPTDLVVDGVVGAYLALIARWLDEAAPHTPAELDAAFRDLLVPGATAIMNGSPSTSP